MEETVASQALRDSEELYRTTLLSMSDAVFITTDDGTFTFVCPNVDVIFGYGEDEVRGMERISRLLGSDLVRLEHLAAAGEVRNIEHEIATKDGAHRILLVHIKRVAIRRGTILYVCRDITERKQSEQAQERMAQELRDLGGRLIDAHEQERRRLARELHDGVGQRVALLSAEMTLLRKQLTGSPPMLEHVRRVLRHIEEVGSELHRVSHELHPAWLEHLGFDASIRRICAELSDTHRIVIHLEIGDIPAQLGQDVALCLYRIAQEALHNIVKHSQAATATVRLEADPAEIVLHVIDDGVGFDPALEHELKGVGLVSMRERARHAGGDLTLTTKPGEGTRVQVRVPIAGSVVC
jgi:PAS domain S-box-containing protein